MHEHRSKNTVSQQLQVPQHESKQQLQNVLGLGEVAKLLRGQPPIDLGGGVSKRKKTVLLPSSDSPRNQWHQ